MRLQVYHIVVEHGDNREPCSCTDQELDCLSKQLPDVELLEALIRGRLNVPACTKCKAAVKVHSEVR